MAQVLSETIGATGWPGGVITAADPTLVPAVASPRGLNSALSHGTTGTPYVQKRMGLRTINTTPISGSGAIIGQFDYFRVETGVNTHILISDTGRIDSVALDGTLTNISTALTVGTYYPDFQVANDLLFIVNGQEAIKYDGTSVTTFGITRPTVGAMAGAAGAAGSPSGTYELRVTYSNSSTGAESSASDTAAATVTVVNQKINVTGVPTSGDSQVDTRYIYVGNTATQVQFYRAGTISDNVTTTIVLDFLDANLTTVAPGRSDNDPPPSGMKFLALHQGRMFASDGRQLYYSQIDQPEAFAAIAFESVNQDDGQAITGLVSDTEVLIVLKEDSVYGVFNGNQPASWEVRLISAEFGCASHRTIRDMFGFIYWWGRQGLVRWGGAGQVDPVGIRLYGDPSEAVSYENILAASACRDAPNTRYIVALPSTGKTRATFMLPFNVVLGVFESDSWDPMDCASMGESVDSDNMSRPYMGNYAGQVFRVWDTNTDGVASETTGSGTFVASGTSVTTITDVSAAFDTTGSGLIERKVSILDEDGVIVTVGYRPYIISNTATTVTMNAAVEGLIDGATYTYYIGGPDFQFDTPWRTFDLPWVKKRFEYLFILIKGASYGAAARIDMAFDYDDANSNSKQRTFTAASSAGTWDDPLSLWDSAVWDSPTNIESRFRVARTGRAYRVRLRNGAPSQPFAVLMIGTQAVAETVKR